jgi:hypothetical protein
MFRYGFFAIGLCLLLTSAFSQSSSQIDGASVVGFWSNAANPNEHFELRADGQFSIAENGQHHEGTWDLHGNTLALHFSPSFVGKAQWDGQAFIDNEQKRWVRATLTSTAQNPPASASAGTASAAQGQSGDQKALLQKRLDSQFKVTKTTTDKSDITTAGAVLVLHKDGLVMYSISNPIPPQSTYKKGKITRNVFGKNFWRDFGNTMATPGTSVDIVQRNFVADEKFWVTKVDVKDDGVVFGLYSDPYDDVRYFGELKFPFPKGSAPPADEELKTIAEAVTVQPDDNAAENAPQQPPAQAAQPEQALAPIPPPPPPPDAPPPPPKTISLGETRDQVVATLGQPQKVVNLGAKEIDYYPDMKVTFLHGKVVNVQ